MTPGEIRQLEQQYFPSSDHPARLEAMSNEELEREVIEAQKWLLEMLDSNDRLLDKENQMRLFRSAVEKQLAGSDLSEKEQLYMALTDYELSSPQERLRSGLILVLHLGLNNSLKDANLLSAVRTERLDRAANMDSALEDVRELLAEKARSITVDNIACAIPLSESIEPKDENAGCCPVCQSSYIALHIDQDTQDVGDQNAAKGLQNPSTSPEPTFRIEDLLADYPVRVKYCGHIMGKRCLETWMATPKIEEAKFPHRTCPFCRAKLEGVKPPVIRLLPHFKGNIRALETVRELVWGHDLEIPQCLNTINACMSEEIACEELITIVSEKGLKKESDFLKEKLRRLNKEKWAWGFRGNGIWAKIREEWMNSGVRR
jgi:hypothetical protein